MSRLSTQDVREARQASRHLLENAAIAALPAVPVSDQDEREELFFAVLANPGLLDDLGEAA